LRNWIKQEKAERGERPGGLSGDEREELGRLRDENAKLRMAHPHASPTRRRRTPDGARAPGPGLIHHSDQGSGYVSLAFGHGAHQAGIAISMGPRGDAYDNAVAETLFATLKKELVNRRSRPSRLNPVSGVRIHRGVLRPDRMVALEEVLVRAISLPAVARPHSDPPPARAHPRDLERYGASNVSSSRRSQASSRPLR
jgi:transposase InsO family protein